MKPGVLSAVTMAMLSGMANPFSSRATLENGVHREYHPWEFIQLSKAQRKGKTPEELQDLRKEIYNKLFEKGETNAQ